MSMWPPAPLLAALLLLAEGPGASRDFRAEANAAAEAAAWADVVAICQAWERADPRTADAPLCIAQARLREDRPEQAADAARRALERAETSVTRFYMGVANQALGRLEEARQDLARSVVLDPKDPSARHAFGRALAALGRYAEARDQAIAEKRLAPNDFGADDRLDFWNTAARWKFPREALRRHGRAGWLMEQRRYDEAAQELQAALKLAPAFADCHYHLGWCHQQRSDLPLAAKAYRSAIEAYPPTEDRLKAAAYYNLSGVLSQSKSPAEAAQAARQALALGGDRWYFLLALGGACGEAGDKACAADAHRRILRSHEEVPEVVQREARRVLDELQEPLPGKERVIKVSVRVEPAAFQRCEHGLMLMEQRRPAEAIADLQEGLKLQPGHAKCRADLAGAYVMAGDLVRAEREVRTARLEPHTAVDAEWRASAAMLLAQLVAAGPGRGPDGGREGLALLEEAAAVGLAEPPSLALLLRGVFCDWAGRADDAIAAFERYLALDDAQRPEARGRVEERLRALKRSAATSQ